MDMIYNFWKGGTKGKEDEKNSEEPKSDLKTDETNNSPAKEKVQVNETETPKVEDVATENNSSKTNDTQENEGDSKVSNEENSSAKGVDMHEVSHKAMESAKSIGSFLFSVANKAGRSVSETAKHLKHTVEENAILADFNKEQDAFLKSKSAKGVGDAPWVGCADEESVKQQILSLSQDKRNFVRSPPSGVQFNFEFDEMYPIAMVVLEEDKQLQTMRFELVPKLVTEEAFWRNYFYRVSLVKQSNQLSSLTQERGSSPETDSRSSIDEASDDNETVKVKKHLNADDEDSLLDSPSHEFVSDAYANSKVSAEDIKQGMKQLGVTERAGHGLK